MNRDAVLKTLKHAEAALRSRGVVHAAVFGSVARGDAAPDSDIDIMVAIAPDAEIGLFGFVDIVHIIEDMFSGRVDVSDRDTLKAHVRPSADRDAAYAF